MNEQQLRLDLIATGIQLNAAGLNRGTSGNLSARCGEGFLVTPSGLTCEEMTPADIVFMAFDGHCSGPRNPSSEWRFHRDILASRPEIGAVVHTHSMFATTLACLGLAIPAFHYMIALAGGKDIRCAPYATFGSEELSAHALRALEGRRACLLANHGMIALGATPADAAALALEVETLCEQYGRALQIGTPKLLSDAEMDVVLEKFKNYGKQAQGGIR